MLGDSSSAASSASRPTHLGPYELGPRIGRGGMGEVYRGRDTRLGRTVAIKILPPELHHGAEARARFQREARAIAALNHAHVCVVHDVGQASGLDFLVMEYVDGESLASRLARGPLPLDEVLARAIEVLDGLAHAHAAGVVHRDIKPGNIMLTKSGAKLLDFGIAALRRDLFEVETVADSVATGRGQSFGTLQYMAPEQLEGVKTDARTDLFACGLVLFEMATGRKAVAGESTTAIITSILTGQPASVAAVLPECPPDLDWAIRRCLARDPEQRWQSAADLSAVLRWIQTRTPDVATAAPLSTSAKRPVGGRAAALAAIAALTLVGGTWFVAARWREPSPAGGRALRATIPIASGALLGEDGLPALALSPDGRRLVYAAALNGTTSLYVRTVDRLESTPLAGTEGGTSPFFSPDGNSLGFFAARKLKRVSFDGTAPVVICDAPRGRGGSWHDDGTIVFAASTDSALSRVAASGGRPQPVTTVGQGTRERSHRWPELLPGGRTVLFTSGNPTDNAFSDAQVVAQSLHDPADRRVLLEGSSYARYAAGHLLYLSGNSLVAARFDPEQVQITGTPFTIVEAVSHSRYVAATQMTVSQEGALVYLPAGGGGTHMTLAFVDRTGKASPIGNLTGQFTSVRLSPDGSRAAFYSSDEDADVHVYDLRRQRLNRITYGPEFEGNPVWSPDGTRIVYASERGPGLQMFWKRWNDPRGSPGALAQRSQQDEALAPGEHARIPQVWSADGQLLAFTENHPDSRRDIWLMPAGAGAKSFAFVSTPFEDNYPAFSPDSQWLAYQSNESGGDEIYARRVQGDSPRIHISAAGGAWPRWAANGDLFYWSAGHMVVVPVIPRGGSLQVGQPQQLFRVPSQPYYDVTADGQRLLMLQAASSGSQKDLVLVDQWAPAVAR